MAIKVIKAFYNTKSVSFAKRVLIILAYFLLRIFEINRWDKMPFWIKSERMEIQVATIL